MPELQLPYNSSTHEATEHSPAYLNFVRVPRHPNNIIDKVLDGKLLPAKTDVERLKYLKDIQELEKLLYLGRKKTSTDLRRKNKFPLPRK